MERVGREMGQGGGGDRISGSSLEKEEPERKGRNKTGKGEWNGMSCTRRERWNRRGKK